MFIIIISWPEAPALRRHLAPEALGVPPGADGGEGGTQGGLH